MYKQQKGWGALYAAATAPETQPEGGQGLTPSRQSYKSFLVDMTAMEARPDYRLRCRGVGLIPAGSITAISGQAKQGKTQFLIIVSAIMMSGRSFGSMQAETPARCVLWADTEQSLYDLQANLSRLYAIADIPKGTPTAERGLHVLSLRSCSDPEKRNTAAQERLAIIQQAIDALNPDAIIIDGVRDLLSDFNDIKESNDLMTWLMQTSAQRPKSNIFCVLHTNDGTTKMRGHLGTELMNKCADRFDVTKKEGYFEAQHVARHQELSSPFFFRFDEAGNLVSAESGRDGVTLIEPAEATLHNIMEGKEAVPFDEIVRAFAKAQGLSQTKAKAYCQKEFIEPGLIVNAGRAGWRLA